MISKFVREQKRYTQQDLCSILECTESEVVGYIRKLKEYGVLKAVKASDLQKDLSELQEEDIEIADVEVGENVYLYVFTFVGVIVLQAVRLSAIRSICFQRRIQQRNFSRF